MKTFKDTAVNLKVLAILFRIEKFFFCLFLILCKKTCSSEDSAIPLACFIVQ